MIPEFDNEGINDILGNYSIKEFKQAFPTSRFLSSRQVYSVIANSTFLAAELTANYPVTFPHYEITSSGLLDYYPVDYWSWLHTSSSATTWCWYLDHINAPKAWDYTHGDPSVIIGVTDNGFDITNPDWVGRIASTNLHSAAAEHGTVVAGRLACNTDNVDGSGNPVGWPAVGFNCRLHLSDYYGADNEMLAISNSGIKVINASWWDLTYSSSLNLSSKITQQNVYNEIYENGTSAVFAAGNGHAAGGPHPYYYQFPSSLYHNLAITQVEGENCASIGNPTYADAATCNVHAYGSDTFATLQHHSRVALCAPNRRTGGLTYNATYPVGVANRYFTHDNNGGAGTSFSAPLVSGTLGLMLSANPCLSPYQREYALKWGSNPDIYSHPANAYLYNTSRWDSRMGVGRLDVGASVAMVHSLTPGYLNCNDVATQTFFIEGVELKTICAPGYSSNSILPQFFPVLRNGTAPYVYLWQPVPGNTAVLDNYNIANPTITGSSGSHLAYFRLTVFDASQPEKIANRDVRVQLKTTATYDLAMRDSYVDMLDELNTQGTVDTREWTNLFSSPDLWNRKHNDLGMDPENAEYFLSASNYMRVRVRNVGCANYSDDEDAKLRVYWTLASTGENWAADWIGVTTVPAAGGGSIPAGGEITSFPVWPIPIPNLAPGDEYYANIPWYPQDPASYVGTPTNVDVCFLARIEEPYKSILGMYAAEVAHTPTNVRNSNNIVTRNTYLVNLGNEYPSPLPYDIHRVYVANTGSAQVFSLEMLTERDVYRHFAGNLSEYMYATVKMNDALYAAWSNGGLYGNYAALDQQNKTVTYDPSTPLRLDSIALDSGTVYYADITFTLRTPGAATIPANQKIYFQQLYNDNGNERVYGRVEYHISIADTVVADTSGGEKHQPKPVAETKKSNYFTVFPNPVSDVLNIAWLGDKEARVSVTIMDITGRMIIKHEGVSMLNGTPAQINFGNVSPGLYLVHIQDEKGYRKTYKVTKTR